MPRFAIEARRAHITVKRSTQEEAIQWGAQLLKVPATAITCRPLTDNPPAQGTTPETMKKDTTAKTKAAHAASKPAKKGTTKKSLSDRVEKAAARKEKAVKGLSGLDAAALVLQDAEPMTAKQIVEAIQTRKLAPKLSGKTPHATIYAAMITEISKKGKDSRFARGKEKGTFTSNSK
jgi:hypothetical protein